MKDFDLESKMNSIRGKEIMDHLDALRVEVWFEKDDNYKESGKKLKDSFTSSR